MKAAPLNLMRALAKMLPSELIFITSREQGELHWLNGAFVCQEVLSTELMDLCWRVKEKMDKHQLDEFDRAIARMNTRNPYWYQETIALAKVLGIIIE